VRRLSGLAWWLVLAGLVATPAHGQSDFDPSGRRGRSGRPRPSTGSRAKPPAAKPPAAKPRADGPAPAPRRSRERPPDDSDPTEAKKPDVDTLIQRYTSSLLAKPHDAFPLQRLMELYRQRDGNIDKLVKDFEGRAAQAGADQFNAKLALAGIYAQAQRRGEAAKLLEQAIADKPKLAVPRLMLAAIAEQQNDKARARKHYEAALPLVVETVEKERVLRALMVLCVELKDFDAARQHHQKLVAAAGGSLFVKKELGSELLNRGHYKLAEEEFRKIVKAASGDNRALAPALRDLGKALAKQRKMSEALDVLTRARRSAGDQGGIRREILALLTEVYREQGKLTELITVLEAEPGRDFERNATIGQLYEETGQVDKALKAYRQALALDGKDIDVRVKLVHLLHTAGQLDEAIKEYEALIRAAPHNADFVFELCETLIQRGDRDKALKLVEDLERRSGNEADNLAAVADFYERIEEQERAVKVLERLAKVSSGDPQHLIDLGDRYFQHGDKKKAEATWLRIRTVVGNRARAAAVLGEVYLDHDMTSEALESFREAVKLAPANLRYKKQLATALERTAGALRSGAHRYREALTMWEQLLSKAGDDALLARECRTHIVSLWGILRELPEKVAPLGAKLAHRPPDLEAGRLLAEVHRRLNKLKESEQTLRKVIKLAPGDEESLLALERVLVLRRELAAAIDVLKKLVDVNPKRAREYYQRMSQYAAELYRDDDAIKYAARAVELSPGDATGHHRLGQMYRRRQDNERAMQEFRKAISKNDRLFRAYFDLAEILISSGKVEDADQLYRRVIRASRDEEFVMRGARLSMQINLGKGTLESLERELLPVALGNPQKPLYRRLLVELYGAMTFPLVHRARFGGGESAKKARDELTRIGTRAVKPLLDALTDENPSQQRVAIEVLAYVQNKGAGPALFMFASGQAERELRVRAMVACGALADPDLLERYEALLLPKQGEGELAASDSIAVAAAWGVARMGEKGEPLLRQLLRSPSPDIRALGALGLGLAGQREHADALAEVARSPESGPTARAAAVHALGELGTASQRSLLLALTDSPETPVKLAALLSLARLGARAGGGIPQDLGAVLAQSLLSDDGELRRTAIAAATAIVSADYRRGAALPVPDGAVSVTEVLRGLAPSGYRRDEQARALVALKTALTQAALDAVATSPERARVVAELTMSDLMPLIDAPGERTLEAGLRRELAAAAGAISRATVSGFVGLARHPSADVRKRAIEFLARRPEREAHEAIVSVLSDREPEVCKTALSSLRSLDQNAAAVTGLLRRSRHWSIRVRAAEALARIGNAKPSDRQLAVQALSHAAQSDRYALVREAALRSLAAIDRAAAAPVLDKVAASDREARLKRIARELKHRREVP
jgi:tetratricopeptide (TPR) repeat protein